AKALGQNKHMLIKQLLQCSLFSCHQSFDHMTFYYRMTSALFTHCSLNVTQTHTNTHTHTHRHRHTHTHEHTVIHIHIHTHPPNPPPFNSELFTHASHS